MFAIRRALSSFSKMGGPRRSTLLILLIAGIAACSGQTCSCIQPLKGGFPLTQRRANGVQTRITESFLDYVSANATTIVPGVLPGGTTFKIPPSCGSGSSTQICCGTPQPTCSIAIDPRSLTLTPAAPSKLSFNVGMIVKTVQNIPVTAEVGFGIKVHCVISLDTTRSGGPTMNAKGDVNFNVDPGTNLTSISLTNADITNLDDNDLKFNEPGSDSSCGIANLGIFKGLAVDLIKSQVTDLLGGVVEGQLCQTCTDKNDCTAAATSCTKGQCLQADGKTCVQLLGIEGRADVGSLLSDLSPQTRAYMDVLEAAGGYALANTGLSLGVLGGSQADPHSACVPIRPPPAAVEVSPSVSFQGDVVPGTTTPYHVGIGIHVAHLSALAFSFWDAGGLCLGITGQTVAQLNAKTLEIIMPSLANLIRGDDAPMAVQIRPQNPPTLKLGKGTFKMVGTKKVVDDPLLTLIAPEFTADFYLFIDDRYVRVATLTTDLTLPLGLDSDMNGKIIAVAGDFSKAFTNVKVTNTELLSETSTDLEALFPTVFGAALDPLFSNLTFTLPSFAGLAIKPTVITSTDPDTAGVPQYLGIFTDIKPSTTAFFERETSGRVVSVQTPPTAVFAVRGRDGRVPSVTVAVDGVGPTLEWSYAFDGGLWHPFQSAESLTLSDAGLWLQGRHVVAIRARVPGHPESLDATPLELPFFIDSEAPAGTFLLEGGKLVPRVSDRVTRSESLLYRVNGGAFTPASNVQIPAGSVGDQLVVEARDEAGNIGVVSYQGVVLDHAASGCSMSTRSSSGGALWIVALLGLALHRRRALLALLLLPMLGCSHSSHIGIGDQLDPKDEIGRSHDAKIREGNMYLTAYDSTYGDLAYAKVALAELANPIAWTLVDGDDLTEAASTADAYRHGRIQDGPDVGFYSSLALTSTDDARIAYFDATNHSINYAAGPFPFAKHAIDTGSTDGTIEMGQYAAITLDLANIPIVAYMAVGLGDPTSGFRAELRVARAQSDSPTNHDSWNISTLDTAAISCGGRCPSDSACVITAMVGGQPNTDPAISTCLPIDLAPCPKACNADQACVQKVCEAIVAAPVAGSLPPGTGLFAQFARNTIGKHALVYYEQTHGLLKLATEQDDGSFVAITLDGKAGSDKGQFSSATYGSDGTLHVTYKDAIFDQLLYKSVSAAGVPSDSQIVDNGLREDGPHPVGASASVIADGTVAVLYQDQATADLVLAQQASPWAQSSVRAGQDGSGFSSHLLSADDKRYYTTWVFDRAQKPLGRLVVSAVP